MLTRLRQTLIGPPLSSVGILHERLNKIQALAVFSSDALSSMAYATEEILLVPVVAGTAALDLSLPIALAIVALLAIVASSYYQTIHGYPFGGGCPGRKLSSAQRAGRPVRITLSGEPQKPGSGMGFLPFRTAALAQTQQKGLSDSN